MIQRTLALVAIAMLVGAAVFAQPLRWTYVWGYSTTGTSLKITLQLAANSENRVRWLVASVTCPSATCTAQTIRGGTAATGTPLTYERTRTDAPADASADAYGPSNSTGGTSLPAEPLLAGKTVLDMSDLEIKPGEVVSLLISSGSSQVLTVNSKHEEYPK